MRLAAMTPSSRRGNEEREGVRLAGSVRACAGRDGRLPNSNSWSSYSHMFRIRPSSASPPLVLGLDLGQTSMGLRKPNLGPVTEREQAAPRTPRSPSRDEGIEAFEQRHHFSAQTVGLRRGTRR